MGKTTVLFLALLTGVWSTAPGQTIKVKGYFVEDSVPLGNPVAYVLVAEYPGSVKVLFPDSAYNFAPFEYVSKWYAPSELQNGNVVDSVVYQVTTFEMDPYQRLGLPVFQLRLQDSLVVYALPDSVQITGLLTDVPEDAKLKETTNYHPLYSPYLVVGVLIFLIICGLIFLIFGQELRLRIKLRRLRKRHDRYSRDFTALLRKIKEGGDLLLTEKAFSTWKSYLESLERIPYTKLTSREILKGEANEKMKEALKAIDRNIYGQVPDAELYRQFEVLGDISMEKYKKKVEEVKYGRGTSRG